MLQGMMLKIVYPAAVVLALSACAGSSDDSGLPRPTSQADATAQAQECMHEMGWEVKVVDGATEATVPNDQYESYVRALSACADKIGLTSREPLTESEFKDAYQRQTGTLECLNRLGFDLPSGPSVQEYIDSSGAWTPYSDLPDMSALSLKEVEEKCPQQQIW